MKSRSRFSALLVVTALLLLSVGVASAQDKTTVTVWEDAAFATDCWTNAVKDGFNAASTDAQVDIVAQPDAWDTTRTAVTGGAGPDVVTSPGPSFVQQMAAANLVLPLDDYVSKYGWDKTFVPWSLSLGDVNGKLYSLPAELETLVLYYNKTLFQQHNWTPPKTMDELVTLAQQISDAGIIPFAHGNADWRASDEWFVEEFFNHIAGPNAVYQALTGKLPWTDASFAKAIDTLNMMQAKGWFSGGLDKYYTADTPTRMAAFGSGKEAMDIEGTWRLDDINTYFGQAANNTNDWDWVPVPSETGDAIFDIGIGSTWSINANTKVPDAAAEFLNYYFGPDVQASLLAQCGQAPAPVTLPADAMKQLDPRVASIFTQFAEASKSGNYGYTSWAFWPPQTENYISDGIEHVWAGDITTADYLQTMNTMFAQELTAGAVPPIPAR